MAQETNQSPAPLLCSTGCGFYASPRNDGMCSVCYRDFLQKQNSSGRSSPPGSSADCSVGESLLAQRPDASSPPHTPSAADSGSTAASETSQREESPSGAAASVTAQASTSDESLPSPAPTEEEPKAKKNRCFTCRKKLGLTGFDCRCGNVFCGPHRYSDVHRCTFDYRAEAAQKIRKENPLVVGEKIQKL